MSFESKISFNHLIFCWPLLLSPLIFPSIRAFYNGSVVHIRGPKYWSFGFSISPSNEYSGLIFFRMDWLDLAVQGTLKHLLQQHSSKASILEHSAFFMAQLSHPYMTTGKTITLIRWTFVGQIITLLFNKLSRILPRIKCLLISWLHSPAAVILKPPKNKVCHSFCCFPIYLAEPALIAVAPNSLAFVSSLWCLSCYPKHFCSNDKFC